MLTTDIEVPVGNAIGGMLLSGLGPKFKIKILSVADVETCFTDSFSEAGNNQTRHKIYLNITVSVDILVPGYKARTLEVSNQVAVARPSLSAGFRTSTPVSIVHNHRPGGMHERQRRNTGTA
jgi:putative Mn2+ efflux pump MntP